MKTKKAKKSKYTVMVDIKASVGVQVEADSLEEAINIAQNRNDSSFLDAKNYSELYDADKEVVGVYK